VGLWKEIIWYEYKRYFRVEGVVRLFLVFGKFLGWWGFQQLVNSGLHIFSASFPKIRKLLKTTRKD
jgi:hypothetical protein